MSGTAMAQQGMLRCQSTPSSSASCMLEKSEPVTLLHASHDPILRDLPNKRLHYASLLHPAQQFVNEGSEEFAAHLAMPCIPSIFLGISASCMLAKGLPRVWIACNRYQACWHRQAPPVLCLLELLLRQSNNLPSGSHDRYGPAASGMACCTAPRCSRFRQASFNSSRHRAIH